MNLVSSLLLAVSAGVLVSAQAPSPAPAGCAAKSFAMPSWFVEQFHYSGSNSASSNSTGKASFHLINRATNYTADLTCSIARSGWNACLVQGEHQANDTLQASIQVNATSAQFLLNQTWTCDDRNMTMLSPFTAVGNGSVAVENGEAAASPFLVKGSLLSPVAITPVYAWGPTGHDTPGCAAPAKSSWILTTPFYTNQTGDGITSVASQDFTVVATNAATGYEAGCMSGTDSGDGSTSTPTLSLVCAGTEFQSTGGGRYSISTAASFDPSTFRFTINQTWYCDEDPANPVQITATASETLPLTCTSSSIDINDEASGDTRYSCIRYEEVVLAGKHVTETSLQPYSMEDPVVGSDGCTLSSLFHPQWTFSAFEVDSSDSEPSSVGFNIILRTGSPGFQFPISISQETTPLEGSGSWYSCVIGPSGDIAQPLWPTACSFQYQSATQQLTLKADWVCDELDPEHPILFSGLTSTVVNSPLACEAVGGISQCFTQDGAYSWTANINNVTWRQA